MRLYFTEREDTSFSSLKQQISSVELFWYEFRIRNCKNMAKKSSENVQASNKMASQMNVAIDNVTSQCFFRQNAPNLRIIHTFILIRLICPRNPRFSCRIKENVVPFSVGLCVIQTFLSYDL